ncbi:hypothetical protein C8R43DRAFT_479979 [Mycena crocata]|nr:hypothetical protein C8R43DRAFT_479979 [Mycena crocata]
MSVPISCLTGANHYVPIHSDDRPPQMCQVFVSTHDLAVHHAASEDLPPLPLPSRGPSPQQRPPTPNNFASLLDDYLKMRAQPADSDVEGGTKVTRLADAVSGSHNPTGLLQLPSFDGNYNFNTSGPLFGPPRGSVDVSPQETEYDEFSTSPGDDSPFSAFLSTPLVGADNALIPLMDDLWQDNSQAPLWQWRRWRRTQRVPDRICGTS